MKSLKLEVLNDKALRPSGNPFNVNSVNILECIGHYIFDTGIKFSLEENMTLVITPLAKDMFILGWNMADSLQILVETKCNIESYDFYDFGIFASVAIVEKKPLPVRFVEFAKEGGRLITGEPREVKPEPPLCGTSNYCNNSLRCDECSGDIPKEVKDV